jgi:quercetin dioxygenase-like cupin family protein
MKMDIKRGSTLTSRPSDPDHFTGKAWVDQDFAAETPARVRGGIVTFSPGARTDWHAHPLGQTLLVTAGCGWVQRDGGPVEVIRAGDVVWIAPGEKHWHGATLATSMSHVAISEKDAEGKTAVWLEKVDPALLPTA